MAWNSNLAYFGKSLIPLRQAQPLPEPMERDPSYYQADFQEDSSRIFHRNVTRSQIQFFQEMEIIRKAVVEWEQDQMNAGKDPELVSLASLQHLTNKTAEYQQK